MTYKAKLERITAKRGLAVVDCGMGHLQITGGPLLVNYYPESKRRSAYVAGTTHRREHVTPEQAVEMAFDVPQHVPDEFKAKRHNQKRSKLRMWNKHPFCYWCTARLAQELATVDHVVPLSRGGLDNANNKVLACGKCNHDRADKMPELITQLP